MSGRCGRYEGREGDLRGLVVVVVAFVGGRRGLGELVVVMIIIRTVLVRLVILLGATQLELGRLDRDGRGWTGGGFGSEVGGL